MILEDERATQNEMSCRILPYSTHQPGNSQMTTITQKKYDKSILIANVRIPKLISLNFVHQ
jgi:hypothetical protein